MCQNLANGMTGALFLLYMDQAMRAVAQVPAVLLAAALVGTVMLALATRVLRHLADVHMVALAEIVLVAMLVALVVAPAIAPGTIIVFGAFCVSAVVAPWSEVAATVIVARLGDSARTGGADDTALLFGILGFVTKAAVGIGAAAALLVTAGSRTSLDALLLAFAIIPIVLRLAAAGLALIIPRAGAETANRASL